MAAIDLSIIVVVYNMQREAPRTLHSLSRRHQRNVESLNYEVIVVDNGSSQPLPPALLNELDSEFRHLIFDRASTSPAAAINAAAASARGTLLAIMIDGARILTPGVLAGAVRASRLTEHPVAYTLGWHLGHDLQSRAATTGYNQAVEDRLLDSIGWPADGYRLFDIATQAPNSNEGWLHPPGESNCLFVGREDFHHLGGYDEAFDLPGGGLVNQDFFHRAVEMPGALPVVLLGEGSFHQIHGGIMTSAHAAVADERFALYKEQYQRLRGKLFARPVFNPLLLGQLPAPAARFLRRSLDA